ncbi:MAG: sodium ion-translocating decarboxylase subunit beta, partial [Chlorobium phaeobacteroides]|nr:sodium ion-translocating decarboxylase subunit beta [Chlorobium phaeobacteroides]
MRTIIFVLLSMLCLTTTANAEAFFREDGNVVSLQVPEDLELVKLPVKNSRFLRVGDEVQPGDFLGLFADEKHNKISVVSGISGTITSIHPELYSKYTHVPAGTVLLTLENKPLLASSQESKGGVEG